MEIRDIENICWICGRSREELNRPFDDVPFSIPLLEVKDAISYSGYHICAICESIIATVGGPTTEFVDECISERLEILKKDLIQTIKNLE